MRAVVKPTCTPIVALDFSSAKTALDMVGTLGDVAGFYKVGLELFTRVGPSIVEELRSRRKRVFLDLKLHDIPNTVSGAVASAGAAVTGASAGVPGVGAAGGQAAHTSARAAAAN